MADPLPRRIWIVGPTGAGKSTVAAALAARLGVSAVHLDDLHWAPGWVERSEQDLIDRLAPLVAGDAWVVDGNYSHARRAHGGRAELFVWLDLPFRTTFPRLLRRAVNRSFSGETCCNGNRESLSRAFLHKDSILLWSIRTRFIGRRDYAEEFATRPHLRLRSAREVSAFVERAAAG